MTCTNISAFVHLEQQDRCNSNMGGKKSDVVTVQIHVSKYIWEEITETEHR